MLEGQISIFDKPKVELKDDCSKLHPLLTKGSIHELYMEKENNYIIFIDNVFYGPLKKSARKC
ncbi:hypothetical protein [Clostridium chrysemydis]|uniref:hypothetical protein n=1 Tax=Clostridium chrysemydis TaxID=2665504 RepID=UPI0018838411|nr:hypothetical protein [Clostridium chrysemydis]